MTAWFVTGASRGMGREVVEQALERGDQVAATLRRPEQLDELKVKYGDRLHTWALDVSDVTQIDQVLNEAFQTLGRIDVVVSNAGAGVFGAAEDISDEQVDRMIAVNLTGSIQLARRAVRHLRDQGGGTIVQLSSQGGHITYPGFAIYHATKWGIEGWFETLATEIAPFGIRTILVEPGLVRTGFYDAAERVPLSEPYLGGLADRPAIPLEDMVGSQSGVAHALIEAAVSDSPPLRLLTNSDAYDNVITALEQRLADLRPQRAAAAAANAEYPPAGGVAGN